MQANSPKTPKSRPNFKRGYSISIMLALILTSVLLSAGFNSKVVGRQAFSQSSSSSTSPDYNDNIWYLGKGVKANSYYTYKIQDHDTNEGQPFTMTLYFKDFNKGENYWIVPVYVVDDQGKVINGTFHLSALDLSVLGTSNIPSEMKPYRSAYTGSLQWLASFVPKPGQSLAASYWGKIASIGGSAIGPSGSAKIKLPAGTYDTTLLSYHKGVDNRIWINKDLPYPVKAETYADVTTGKPPIQYAFNLQATGQGQPPIPISHIQAPKSPLTLQTGRGTYYIQLLWEPKTLQLGKDTKFGIIFMDSSKTIIKDVIYSFKVTDPNGSIIKDLRDQKALDGTSTQTLRFTKLGPVNIIVGVDAAAGQTTGDFVENVEFHLPVQGSSITSASL
ncbi:MAG: hypothetical protein M3297_16745 [Thermoproteota archaeon]|nr:hypothetical protein [Thermoproteota archaeon]